MASTTAWLGPAGGGCAAGAGDCVRRWSVGTGEFVLALPPWSSRAGAWCVGGEAMRPRSWACPSGGRVCAGRCCLRTRSGFMYALIRSRRDEGPWPLSVCLTGAPDAQVSGRRARRPCSWSCTSGGRCGEVCCSPRSGTTTLICARRYAGRNPLPYLYGVVSHVSRPRRRGASRSAGRRLQSQLPAGSGQAERVAVGRSRACDVLSAEVGSLCPCPCL